MDKFDLGEYGNQLFNAFKAEVLSQEPELSDIEANCLAMIKLYTALCRGSLGE